MAETIESPTIPRALGTSPAGAPKPAPELEQFDWRRSWYPVVFLQDFDEQKPYGFTIYDERFVLFREAGGKLVCLEDCCRHRCARLSDGQIIDGRLECFYHGWQYGDHGECLHVPQLPNETIIPWPADVASFPVVERQGIVWVWPGNKEEADEALLPLSDALDDPDVISVDFMFDLPYDQSYLIENVIDIAHIHIAHDGVRGGGLRELAKPLEFAVQENTIRGIKATFRSLGLNAEDVAHDLNAAQVEFVAPNLIMYVSRYRDPALKSGLLLYSLPQGERRCRLIYRAYSNFYQWRERWKPRWLSHQTQQLILEQDMQVVIGQHEYTERSGKSLKEIWLPIKTSDVLVLEYRRWMDRYGTKLPMYRGYTSWRSPSPGPIPKPPIAVNRMNLHTKICSSCTRVYNRLVFWKKAITAAAIGLGAVAVLTAGTWMSWAALAAGLVAAGVAFGASKLQTRFE